MMIRFYLFLFICGLCSCSSDLAPAEYINYVRNPENGLAKEVAIGETLIGIQYEPQDYLALKELRRSNFTKEDIEKMRTHFSDYFYFKLDLTSNENVFFSGIDSTTRNFYDRQLKFHLSEYLFLIDNGDTLKCLMSQLDNTGGIGDKYSFAMIFEKKNLSAEGNIEFLFIDKFSLTGREKVSILLSKGDLLSVPSLKI